MTPNELLLLRRDARVSQAQLATAIGYSRQAITQWERGRHPIPDALVPRIIAACSKPEPAPPTRKNTALINEVIETYAQMRKDGFSHLYIVELWNKSNFVPPMEAQQAIVEAYPDIIA